MIKEVLRSLKNQSARKLMKIVPFKRDWKDLSINMNDTSGRYRMKKLRLVNFLVKLGKNQCQSQRMT